MKAIRVRLIPNKDQEKLLWQSVGTARWSFNWALNKQIENYAEKNKFIQDGILRKELTQMKRLEGYEWLSEVSNDIPKQAIKDCCNSFKRFFKKQSGFPRFKSKKRSRPSFYNDTEKLEVKRNYILLSKIGWIKLSEKDRIPIKQKGVKHYNPRISNDGKYWYISVGIDNSPYLEELTSEIVGIDVGIKDLAVCSNRMKFKNINKSKSVKKLKKRLRRLQRKLSRKYILNKKGEKFVKTCNIIKLEKQIKLLHRRLKNIRENHIHQSTSKVVKTKPQRIVMEDLNISGMMKNKHLSKAIQEQCLYKFKTYLKNKCEAIGIEFIEADRFYPSSKMCSKCGNIKKDLKLSDRTYICPICGYIIDRDLNASINLMNYESITQSP